MSIYAQLLDDALGQTQSAETLTAGDALGQLVELRYRWGATLRATTAAEWAPAAIADQLAYDVALIELSQRLAIDVSPMGFGQPQRERTRLEQALVASGIRLDELE